MTQANALNSHDESAHGHGHGHGHDGHDHDEPHVLPISVYLGIWGSLVVLTVITVAVSRFDFGSMNTVIAMLVATIKASLVALYFMHLRYDNKFNLIILVASLLFVSIFFTPTLTDLATRGALDPIKTRQVYNLLNAPPAPPRQAPAAVPPAPASPTATGTPTTVVPSVPEPAPGTPLPGGGVAPALPVPAPAPGPSAPKGAPAPSPDSGLSHVPSTTPSQAQTPAGQLPGTAHH